MPAVATMPTFLEGQTVVRMPAISASLELRPSAAASSFAVSAAPEPSDTVTSASLVSNELTLSGAKKRTSGVPSSEAKSAGSRSAFSII